MSYVLFGIGSALAVEYVETCRRRRAVVVAGVLNRPSPHFLGDRVTVVDVESADETVRRAACLAPLFTPANRHTAVREAEALGFRFTVPLIDPTVISAEDLIVGAGSFVNAGVVIGASTVLGDHVVVNRSASLGHHVVIGAFASLGPGAVLAGDVHIGRGAMVGAGAIVLPGVSVGNHAVIGAGSVITADVPPYTKMLGVAARTVEGLARGFPDEHDG